MSHFKRHEFRSYPIIDVEPGPDDTLEDQVRYFVRDPQGNRGFLRRQCYPKGRQFECPITRKRVTFPENLPLALDAGVKPVDFQSFKSVHDGKEFMQRDIRKTHDKLKRKERRDILEKKLFEEWIGHPVYDKVFVNYLHKLDEPTKALEKLKREKKASCLKRDKILQDLEERHPSACLREPWGFVHVFSWPRDVDSFKMSVPAQRTKPKHVGWTHSNEAESWFLEDKTPSFHDDYTSFYTNTLRKKCIVPKLWRTVP